MMHFDIPGRERLSIHHLVLDFNGTIAFDGVLIPGVEERLRELSGMLTIHIITADTNKSVANQCRNIPASIHIIENNNQSSQKTDFVSSLTPNGTVCIGNGRNDEGMLSIAELAIGVIGQEGFATVSALKSDVLIMNINDGLDLLLHPHRLTATLRN